MLGRGLWTQRSFCQSFPPLCSQALKFGTPRHHICVTAKLATKRKMVRIGTHSGTFHCDEALGCFLLNQTDRFEDASVVRSRDPQVLNELDIVIDVGGTYEPGVRSSSIVCQQLPNKLIALTLKLFTWGSREGEI